MSLQGKHWLLAPELCQSAVLHDSQDSESTAVVVKPPLAAVQQQLPMRCNRNLILAVTAISSVSEHLQSLCCSIQLDLHRS